MEAPRMRVFITTVGTRGDVQPFLALATRLLQVGAVVAIATHGEFQEAVDRVAGCRFVPLDGSPTQLMKAFPKAFVDGVISEEIAFSHQVNEAQKENARKIYDGARAFGATMMVSMMSSHLECASVAARLGIPSVVCSTYPLYPTAERLPMAMMANERDFPIWMARMFSWIGFKVSWNMTKTVLNAWRAQIGLGPLESFSWDLSPVVNMCSTLMAPRPNDWPDHVYDTGFCAVNDVLDEAKESFVPPPEVVEFLARGKAPIYFGFGSMPTISNVMQSNMFLRVCQQLGQRGIIYCPDMSLEERLDFSGDILCVGSLPHWWLFPNCCAAVHHGGAGTTAATSRAGIPCVIFHYVSAVLGDQCFWAKRCAALGIGPSRMFGIRDLCEENLLSQLREVFGESTIVENAKHFGEQMRAENGTQKTVDLLMDLFKWISPSEPLEDHWEEAAQDECGGCGATYGVFFNTVRRCATCGTRQCSECIIESRVVMNNLGRKHVCNVCCRRLGHNGTTDPWRPDRTK